MLKKLSGLRYNLIWPDSSWEDVGFTERPIWINNKGWGYIADDEPCDFGKIEAIPDVKWKVIKEKLQNKILKYEDIENTPLIHLEIVSNNFRETKKDEDSLNYDLRNLLSLPDELGDFIYWANDWDDIVFFYNEDEMYKHLDRDWYSQCWKDMDENALAVWIERISSGLGDGFNK